MAEVTGIIGNENVELNNAATEATLKQLLAAVKGMNQSIVKMGSTTNKGNQASGLDPNLAKRSKETADGLSDLEEGVVKTVAGFNPLIKVISGLGGILGGLTASAIDTGKNLVDLGEKAIEGTARMSDFYGAMKDLPLGLGIVAGLFQKIAEFQEKNLDAYRQLSKSGVNFAGSLTDLRMAASEAYLTLDQFQSLVKENSDTFARMGGTVNDGAKNFVKFSHALIDSDVGDRLMALGMTTEELNSGLAGYIKSTGGRNAAEMKDTKALSQAAGEYLTQLDQLAQLTGKSREELEKQQEEAAQDAAYQMALAGKTEEEKAKAAAALAEMQAKYGKAGADAFKAKFLGLPPVSEQAQTLTAMVKGFDGAVGEVVSDVKNQSKSVKDLNKSLTGVSQAVGKAGKDMGPQMTYAMAQGGGALGEAATSMAKHANELQQQGADSAEKEMSLRDRIAKQQDDQAKSQAAAAAEAEKGLKDLGTQLLSALTPIIKALTPVMANLVTQFTNFIGTVDLDSLGKSFATLMTAILDYMKNLFSPEGRQKIINDITYYMKLMLIEIKKAILPKVLYSDEDAKKDEAKLNLEKDANDKAAQAAILKQESAQRDIALQLDSGKLTMEKLAKDRESKQDEIKALEKKKKDGQELSAQEQQKLDDDRKFLADSKAAMALVDKDGKALDKAKLEKQNQDELTLREEGKKGLERAAEIKKADDKHPTSTLATAGAGALAGGAVGSLAGPVGTAVGAAVGGVLGGLVGGARNLYDWATTSDISSDEIDKNTNKDKIPKAADGGVFNGPKSGYPVMLHGNEAVLPMDQLSSILQMPPLTQKAMQDIAKNSNGFSNMMPGTMDISSMKNAISPAGGGADLFSTISSKANQLWNGTDVDKEKDKKPPSFDEMVVNIGKTFQEKVSSVGTNLTTAHMTAEQGKSLVTELQLLNKQTADMLKYIRDTADHAKNTVDATKALNGNLFAR